MAQLEGENEELKKTIEELKKTNESGTARLIEVSSELEKERRNNMRLAYKFEQDFDFHKQQIVNDCGRHIEELQEEHREHIRNIEKKLSSDQRKQNIFAAAETKKLAAEVAELTKQKRDLTYENSLLRIRLKAKRAPREILISGNFVTAMQQKAIPGFYELDEDICHETMEYRPAYKRRELAQGHRIWLVYNKNDRVWNFQPTKKLFSSVSLIFIRSRAVFPTLISSEAVKMASNGQTGWTKIPLDIAQSPTAVEIPVHIDDELEEEDDKIPVVLLDA